MKEILVSGASPVLIPREDPVGQIVSAILLAAILLVCFVALTLLLAAVLHHVTGQGKGAISDRPLPTVLTGLIGYGVLGGVAALLYSGAFIERLLETEIVTGFLVGAVLVSLIPLLCSLLGAPATFSYIGDRIAVLNGAEMSGVRRLLLGTTVAIFASFFPVIGWFVVLPLLVVTSFGAFVLGLWGRLTG